MVNLEYITSSAIGVNNDNTSGWIIALIIFILWGITIVLLSHRMRENSFLISHNQRLTNKLRKIQENVK